MDNRFTDCPGATPCCHQVPGVMGEGRSGLTLWSPESLSGCPLKGKDKGRYAVWPRARSEQAARRI